MHTNTKKVFYLGSTSVLQNYTMSVSFLGYGVIGYPIKNHDFLNLFYFYISNEVLDARLASLNGPGGPGPYQFLKFLKVKFYVGPTIFW